MPEKERKVQEQSEGNRYVGIHVALGMDESGEATQYQQKSSREGRPIGPESSQMI